MNISDNTGGQILSRPYKQLKDEIKIDHYSWVKGSPYRYYSKQEVNGELIVSLSEIMKEKNFDRGMMLLCRKMLGSIYSDPDNLPAHSAWENDGEFERAAVGALIDLIRSIRNKSKTASLKRARALLSRAKDGKDVKTEDIYVRIVFELTEATDREFAALKDEVLGVNS